jgi:hypothetical protein
MSAKATSGRDPLGTHQGSHSGSLPWRHDGQRRGLSSSFSQAYQRRHYPQSSLQGDGALSTSAPKEHLAREHGPLGRQDEADHCRVEHDAEALTGAPVVPIPARRGVATPDAPRDHREWQEDDGDQRREEEEQDAGEKDHPVEQDADLPAHIL